MRVAVLGPAVVERDGARREIAGGRLQALLARLALDAGRPVSAAALVEAVWDGRPPRDEQHALQSLVSRLRGALGDPALIAQDAAGYRLAVAADDVDATRFERLARAGAADLRAGDHAGAVRTLDEALALWRGVPAVEAPRLQELRLAARVDRLTAAADLGEAGEHLAELAELCAEHPLDERLGALRIRALAAAGRQAEALTAYERLRAALADELGAAPSPALQAAHLAVLRGEVASGDGARRVGQAAPDGEGRASRRAGNLPAPRTSFVGREAELERTGELLRRHRLVTLVGTGGAGKTRLALEVAGRHQPTAWLVELASLGDADALAPAMLGALGLSEATLPDRRAVAADAESRLVDALAAGEALVILDNCEHIVEAAARLADRLLAACPGLRILATSREPLAIGGEALAPVGPLDEAAAIALFAERAASASPGFVLDAASEPVVAEVCRRIDGLPLAIELAAARLRSMPLDQLAERLHDRFRLLTGGSRAAAGRQRTLRAVVDWSWDLLGDVERRVLRRLSVFSAGATLDAAEAVCAGDGVEREEVFDALFGLVDRSLVVLAADADPPRWRMLETIREYAQEEAERAGELPRLREAHARHFAALVADADPKLRGPDQLPWLARLRADHDDVLAALRFLAETGRGPEALRMALGLLWLWALSDGREEAITWIRFALDAGGEQDPLDAMMARAIVAFGDGTTPRGSAADALDLLASADLADRPLLAVAAPVIAALTGHAERSEELLTALERHPDPWAQAMQPFVRAQIAENDGRLDVMAGHLDVALERFRAIGDRWGTAAVLSELASQRMLRGDLDGAQAALAETARLMGELGSGPGGGVVGLRGAELRVRRGDLEGARAELTGALEHAGQREERTLLRAMLGVVCWRMGDAGTARALLDEALADAARQPDDAPGAPHQRALVTGMAARVAVEQGDLERGSELLADAHEAMVRARDLPIAGRVGEGAALYALRRGRPADAAEMLGAAVALRGAEDFGHPDTAALLDELRAALGEDALAAGLAAGRGLEADAALARLDPATVGG